MDAVSLVRNVIQLQLVYALGFRRFSCSQDDSHSAAVRGSMGALSHCSHQRMLGGASMAAGHVLDSQGSNQRVMLLLE